MATHKYSTTRKCSKCHIVYPLTEIFFEHTYRHGEQFRRECQTCKRARRRLWYKKNREEICEKRRMLSVDTIAKYAKHSRIRNQRWAKNNRTYGRLKRSRYRAKKRLALINDFTIEQWIRLQEIYNHCCAYCGKKKKGKLEQEHITAISKGGSHTLSNIVPACRSCNARKGNRPPLSPIQPLLIIDI